MGPERLHQFTGATAVTTSPLSLGSAPALRNKRRASSSRTGMLALRSGGAMPYGGRDHSLTADGPAAS